MAEDYRPSGSGSISGSESPMFNAMVEDRDGYRRGIVKVQAEEVEETAKRFKTLEWTREAGTAQDYGAVVPGLIFGIGAQSLKLTPAVNCTGFGFGFELKWMSGNPATARRSCSTMAAFGLPFLATEPCLKAAGLRRSLSTHLLCSAITPLHCLRLQ